eukprot:TRINITY_DN71243_c0_g1_i1.p1 TRINITY_DN71243_c0_g1~~TRINITY_DN71243_c0_g1_i1.p1  ORF type:complete len:275 (-),score=44.27 TRINITY_DN71243_c0_g1_i1:144-968(-)
MGFSHIPVGAGPADETECVGFVLNHRTKRLECSSPAADAAEVIPVPILKHWARKSPGTTLRSSSASDGISEALEVLGNQTGLSPVYLLLGGAQNVRKILEKDQDIFRKTDAHIIAMGGSMDDEGSWNVALDVESWRRMAAAGRVTLVTHGLSKDIRLSEESYRTFLEGASTMTLALNNMQLAFANYGAHLEPCHGKTDVLYDAGASMIAMKALDSLYHTKSMNVSFSDKGQILYDESGPQVSVAAHWVADGADKFQSLLAKSVADGKRASIHDI